MPAKLVNGRGGLPAVYVKNNAATAEIILLGAHLVSYRPAKSTELIWLSKATRFENGVAIRGGIPVCWPWFSKHPEHPDFPMHGFARTANWSFTEAHDDGDAKTVVTMTLKNSPATLAFFPYKFTVKAVFTIADTLAVELITTNDDDKPFTISQALHTYFQIGAIEEISIDGVGGKDYLDKVGGGCVERTLAEGPLTVHSEVDYVFKNAPGPFAIHDEKLGRTIAVTTEGSNSAVVWNPWIEKSKKMSDYLPNSYLDMVCVETCNAADDARTVAPHATHSLKAVYTIN